MKILLIEDDQPTSELLLATLSAHRYAADVVADGAIGLEMAIQWSYDLILLDILLPTLNGIEVCHRLRLQNCQTPILMLTTKNSNEDIIAGLDAGADDYVAKSCDSAQFLARVRALLRRSGSASPSPVLTWGLLCLDPAAALVTYNQETIALRPKEYNLLELFLRHPHRIFSRSAIIDHLWSMEETPVEGSVTTLIKDLRQRLKSADIEADLIETVYGLGYRLKTTPQPNSRTRKCGGVEQGKENRAIDSTAVLAVDWDKDWQAQEQRGRIAIQHIADRFRVSLEQRIAVLEAAGRSLQTGDFSLQQWQAVKSEVHKLAGGLGTFGCVKASEIARSIEQLLENQLENQLNPETQLANSFAQLLEELKQELTKPLIHAQLSDAGIARR